MVFDRIFSAAPSRKTLLFDQIAVFCVFLTLYLVFAGSSYLWDWDETVYAAAAKQMYERGDWIVPIVTDQIVYDDENDDENPDKAHASADRTDGGKNPGETTSRPTSHLAPFYGDKPALMYWGMIASFHLFGVNEFAARFPSAVFGALSLLLVYHIARRLFDRRTALIASFALGTMVLYCVESSAVTPDATLMFWTTAATLCYIIGVFPKKPESDGISESQDIENKEDAKSPAFFPRSYALCLLMYLCLGFAFLDKGPVGVVLPMAVIGMFMLIKRLRPTTPETYTAFGPDAFLVRLIRPFLPLHFLKTVWALRPLTALVAIAVVAAPWYVAIHQETGGAWTELFFGVHNFGRATAAMEGHGYPLDVLWYYPLSLLVITFPWSIFFLPAFLDMIRRLRRGTELSDAYIFACCWTGVYIGVFSLVDTKMPNYIFLASTGAAMIYAAFLANWIEKTELVSSRWFYAALGVLFFVALLIAAALLLFLIPVFVPGGYVLLAVPVLPAYASVRLLILFLRDRRERFVSGMVLTAIVLAISVFAFGAYVVSSQQRIPEVFSLIAEECPDPVVHSFGQFEPSWVFYGGQRVVKHLDNERGIEEIGRFLDEHPRNGYIITCKDKYEQLLQPVYGNRLRIVADNIPYFLKLARAVPTQQEHGPERRRGEEPTGSAEPATRTAFGQRLRHLVVLANVPVGFEVSPAFRSASHPAIIPTSEFFEQSNRSADPDDPAPDSGAPSVGAAPVN